MNRVDYFNDPHAPQANSIVPAASAVVMNNDGKILLHRRSDNALWSLPGGVMEIGESIEQTIVREVKEETGFEVVPEYIVGIYSNPKHIIAYANGEVRQQFSICFACRIVEGEIQVSAESFEVAFFAPEEIERLPMHESMYLRVRDYLRHEGPVLS